MHETYIDHSLDELYSKLGIHKLLSPSDFYHRAAHSIDESNKVIAAHLRIKNPVSISFVPESSMARPAMVVYNQSVSHYTPGRIKFPSTPLVYGSQVPITIEVDERYRNDIHAIGAILAHENTHLLLKLLFCEGNEMYTDLAGMVLGLGGLMSEGRTSSNIAYTGSVTSVITRTIGYLDNESFNYAYEKTKKICLDCENLRLAIHTMEQRNKTLTESIEVMYQTLASNSLTINEKITSLRIKPSHGKQFVEMNNYMFQNDLPMTLKAEKDNIRVVTQKLKDEGGFITSSRGNLERIRDELGNQAMSLRSILGMLEEWLRLQEYYIKPSWWRKLFGWD